MSVIGLGGNTGVTKEMVGTVVKETHTHYLVEWANFRRAGSSTYGINKKNVKEEKEMRVVSLGNTCWWIAKKDVKILKETQISRGDRVLVWDDNEEVKKERIYLTSIEGLVYPHIVVSENYEDKFKQGEEVLIHNYKHMEPLPNKKEMTLEEIEAELGYEKGTLRVKG